MGGFYLYGKEHEELILRPKETYDGAIPSGNSLMSHNLVRLAFITDEEKYKDEALRQIDFLSKNASQYPTNHAMFLRALLEHTEPPIKVTVVLDEYTEKSGLPLALPPQGNRYHFAATDKRISPQKRKDHLLCVPRS